MLNVCDKCINAQRVRIDRVTTIYRCSILNGLMLHVQIHIFTDRTMETITRTSLYADASGKTVPRNFSYQDVLGTLRLCRIQAYC